MTEQQTKIVVDEISPRIQQIGQKAAKLEILSRLNPEYYNVLNCIQDMAAGTQNLNDLNNLLERLYGRAFKERDNIYAKSTHDPKEADPLFNFLNTVVEQVNDCIEIVIDQPTAGL